MKRKYLLVIILFLCAAACLMLLSAPRSGRTGDDAARPAAAAESPAVTAAPTSAPIRTPTPEPTLLPAPEPTPEPVPEIEPRTWVISFAGDCTVGTLHEWRGMTHCSNILWCIGDDYAYPFENVRAYFESDDLTVVNFEGTLTESADPVGKDYRFSAPARYASVLNAGGVDAVSLANNHSGDYRDSGFADTTAALAENGILYGDAHTPLIAELDGGLKLGVICFNTVETPYAAGDVDGCMAEIAPLYALCAEAGCDVIAAFLHWGWEYREQQEPWMTELGHRLAELGCDMVVGGHAHVLQPTELYEDVPIFYSLGNFCFGGHSNPADKDCAFIRQEIVRASDGTYSLGGTEIVPCRISSTDTRNDFRPTPYAEGDAGYVRVLEKMHALPEETAGHENFS